MHYARWSKSYRSAGLSLPPPERKPPKERPQCSIDGCENKELARNWCAKHYWRWQHYGDPEHLPEKAAAVCSVEDCDLPARGRRLCSKHYTRQRRNGDPLIVQQIRGDDKARFESYVNRSGGPDACHPWTGGQCTGGYGQISIKGALELVHIAAWEFEHGPKPPGLDIDHECHNRAVRDGSCRPGICAHRLCCNGAHLVAKTRQEHRDDTEQWAMPRGSSHGLAKLTEVQVIEIRKLIATRVVTQNQIAEWYGVSPRTISRIKLGKVWGWLTEEES